MRLARLDLRAFGPFTGVSLDLSAGAPGGLHVVFGLNEAGKSSALRAVRDLLYGFEHRTGDAHLHRSEDLRLGGLLEGPEGLMYIQRVKRRKDSLLDEHDAPLDEARLRKFLGGVDRDTFTRSFGLGHAELEAQGERMLKGEASVGETLFDAGTGGVDVRRLLENLKAEQDALYRPQGKLQEINRLLGQHAEARRHSQEVWLLPESFQQQTEELASARAELERVTLRLEAVRTEQHRLRALRQALPALQRRAACLGEIAELGAVVDVPEAATLRRERAEGEAVVARAKLVRLEDELSRFERRLGEIEVPEALLAIGRGRINRLPDAMGRTRKGREDLPRREAELYGVESEARAILRRLGRGEGQVSADELRLSAAARGRIRELATEREKLDEKQRSALKRRAELERELDEKRARLSRLELPENAAALEHVARVVRAQGDLETLLAELEQERAELFSRAEHKFADLVPRVGSLAALAALAVPSLERSSALVETGASLAARAAELDGRERGAAERVALAEAALKRIQASGGVPTEAELDRSREERDRLRVAVVSAWRDGAPFAPNPARALDAATERADQVADRLRREAERVAALTHAIADRELELGRVARIGAERAELESALATQRRAELEAWQDAPFSPLTPAEMHGFVERRAKILELLEAVPALERKAAVLLSERQRLERALDAALGQGPLEERLSERLERARSLSAAAAQIAAERSELERTIDGLEARALHEGRELGVAEDELLAWHTAWAQAVRPLGAAEGVPPIAALELLDDLGHVIDLLESRAKLERRVNGIRRDEAEFVEEVRVLAAEHDFAFDDKAPDAAAEAIIERFSRGESAREERTRLRSECAERAELIASERAALTAAERELAELARDYAARDAAELPALEAKSRKARELSARLADLEASLIGDSGGRSVAALVTEAEGQDAPRLSARLDELARELEELDEVRNAAQDRVSRVQAGRERQSDAGGAEAAQTEQTLGAALVERVERYATLRVASALLERAVERYRLENQGPILKRAGELFPRLTDDRYTTLRVGRDDRAIVAVRADGRERTPQELSDGTRYQLYLALRLASVERFIEGAEPLPLVLDDVTIHSDDPRKARTFSVLAELAERVQVLFFTHHARDAELAQNATGGRAILHELGGSRGSEAGVRDVGETTPYGDHSHVP